MYLMCFDAASHVAGFAFATKRAAPAVTLYSANGTSGVWTAAGNVDTAAATASFISTKAVNSITSSGLTQNVSYYGHYVANARL